MSYDYKHLYRVFLGGWALAYGDHELVWSKTGLMPIPVKLCAHSKRIRKLLKHGFIRG
jgi:hypothetical protein